ncbi:MAG: Uncharacterised protein [Synechococcus sp. CC9902]|nr:MAG: Uncharacterised protein [Synechococcus sp. CC9902]
MRSNCFDNLLGQIFDEDQRGDENVGLGDIGTEVGVVAFITQLFDQISAQFNSQIGTGSVQGSSCLGQRVLVLGFENHVHSLHHGFVVLALDRSNSAVGGANLREHQRFLSNVKNLTATDRAYAKISDSRYITAP